MPCAPRSTSTPRNLSSLGTANCCARWAWPWPSTLTAKRPARETACVVGVARFRQASIIGGSSDKEVTELAVMPKSLPCTSVVITVTPLARCPTTWRKC